VRQGFDRLLNDHDRFAGVENDIAKNETENLNKPAPQWTATDIDGKQWSLADLRGKVVVMDFWRRESGMLGHVIPQIRQLAEDYKDKGVVVLGMNFDRSDDDARLVASTFKLQYPQFRSIEVRNQYKLISSLSVLIIDQHGVVRGVYEGYSPNLHDQLAKTIEQLLKNS
jgi:peroxiredoxin